MRRKLIVLLAACLAVPGLPSSPVSAQTESKPENALQLSLAEALRTALENNLDLVIARKNPRIAEFQIETPKAAFDPNLTVTGTYGQTRTKQETTDASTLVNPPNTETVETNSVTVTDKPMGGSAALGQTLKFGGRYSVEWSYSQTHPSPSFLVLGPGLIFPQEYKAWNSQPILTFTQPLLLGFGTEVNTVDIVLAKSNLEISKETLRLNAQTTMQQVENAYWDLLAAIKALEVARESLKLAQDLYDLNKKKVEVGTLAPIEITQAEAGVASREEGVIVAETAVRNFEDNLRMLMAIPKDDPAWSRPILPTDKPAYEARSVDYDAALAKALEHRPEILNARRILQQGELSERVAKRDQRHQLDLTAQVTPIGKTETYNTGPSATELGTAIVRTDNYNEVFDWSVSLMYKFPIKNRAAKARYAIASLNREQDEVSLRNWEQAIRVDVRTAARNVESGVKRVDAAKANTVLQRKTVEAEQKKFENGMSTSFEVLRIQNDLFSAQLAEIQAILSYTKSLADIERAQGTLLEARGLSLDPNAGK